MTSPDSLNAALAVEHATVYAYGVVGAHTSGASRSLAEAGFAAHRAWRERLDGLVRDAGGTPVTADAAYQIERPVTGTASAIALATTLEDGCCVAYERLVIAADEGPLRTTAATALVECATRAARWRLLAGSTLPVAFPGRG
ncbi:MAG: hypothetical protein JWM93_2406 [Frankiales bacterium]|nr:hypothetical protein [Frankiales bacterium]